MVRVTSSDRPRAALARLTSGPRDVLQRKCACGGTPGPSGECEECRKKKLQRRSENLDPSSILYPPSSVSGVPPIVHEVLRSPSQPLDPDTRKFMEPLFGHDFGRVRVHAGAKAAESARAVHALAFTVGQNIVFGAGQYPTQRSNGHELLAHELAHTIQQGNGSEQNISGVSGEADASEREAVMAAQLISHGRTYRTAGNWETHLACQPMSTEAEAPPKKSSKCGPDATSWFVNQVNAALTNKTVIAIKVLLSQASEAASRKGGSSETIAEAGATAAVQAQEINLGKEKAPARSGKTIEKQMPKGVGSEVATAMFALKEPGAFLESGAYIGAAALLWYGLVNHKALYDFKNHSTSMDHPKSAGCPGDDCDQGEVGIITLCPGSLPQNCYESDLPGNLFYALIGRYVGWSELTLQLGSQLAELTDKPRKDRPVITWDTPQDTNAIQLGYGLGGDLPLSRTALCGQIPANRGHLDARTGCEDCLEPTLAEIR